MWEAPGGTSHRITRDAELRKQENLRRWGAIASMRSHLSLTRTVRASSLLQAAPEGITYGGSCRRAGLQFPHPAELRKSPGWRRKAQRCGTGRGFARARSSLAKRSSRLSTTTAWPRFSIRAVKGTQVVVNDLIELCAARNSQGQSAGAACILDELGPP